ncbi:ABC transporter substrate-binding protein [Deinococcus pimensis]|uniref:ABC transporter substrate-binding protein n=1 Tax=Deinococcus pimensis TaxID=309888 RepID=UPI0004839AF9|nr:ABC transporter substrate-binding protein [Deinococcus pimensis]
MRKFLLLAATLSLSSAFAAPFVYPAKWSADAPKDAKRGGELRVAQISDFKTFNPFTTTISGDGPQVLGAGGSGAVGYSTVGLFTQDPTTDDLIPYMAEGMPEVSNGGKRFVVTIRQGMQFSDGQEITADDWVTTARIHADDEVGSNSRDTFFVGDKPVKVTKLGKYRLQFDFPQSTATAYVRMSYTPWPDHVFGKVYASGGAAAIRKLWGLNTDGDALVTPGMWVLDSIRPGERAVFRKNRFFGEWNRDSAGGALPYLDRYSVTTVANTAAQVATFVAGQIDVSGLSNVDQLSQVKRAIDAGQLRATLLPNVSPSASTLYMTFNWNKSSDPFKQSLFRNAKFRHAMNSLIDRDAIIKLVYGGLGTPVYAGVPALFGKFVPADLPKDEYDEAAAAKLLASIGFRKKDKDGWLVDAKGRRLEFNLQTNAGNSQREQIARLFADAAKKVGVKVNTQFIDFNVLTGYTGAKGDNRPFDAVISGFSGGDNIWPFGNNIIYCDGSLHNWNRSGKCLVSQENLMVKLFDQGDAELNTAKRRAIGAQLLKVTAELSPHLYFPTPNYHVTFNSRVGGEFPKGVMDGYYGSRALALTFVR